MELTMIDSWLSDTKFCKGSTKQYGRPHHNRDAEGPWERRLGSSVRGDVKSGLKPRSHTRTICLDHMEIDIFIEDLQHPAYLNATKRYRNRSRFNERDLSANLDRFTMFTKNSNIRYAWFGELCDAWGMRVVESLRILQSGRIFNGGIKATLINAAGSKYSSTGSATISSSMAPASNSLAYNGKRTTKGESDDTSSEANSGRLKRPKRPKANPEDTIDQQNLNFACPYRKHDPATYGLHSRFYNCARSAWQNVSRVKEHIYRAHRTPPHCQKCLRIFDKAAEFDAHPNAEVCKLTPVEPPEGITDDIEQILRRRKKAYPAQTEEDRWMEIYRLLFPEDIVPSPYFEPVQDVAAQALSLLNLNDFAAYSRRETPRLVRSILENESGNDQFINEPNIIRIVQSVQDCLFSEYDSQLPTSSYTTTTIPMPTSPRSTYPADSELNFSQSDYSSTYDDPNLQPAYHIAQFCEVDEVDFSGLWKLDPDFESSGMDTALSSLNHPDQFDEFSTDFLR